jgi:hypothetical protein
VEKIEKIPETVEEENNKNSPLLNLLSQEEIDALLEVCDDDEDVCIEKAVKEAKFEMTDEEMDAFLEAVEENGKENDSEAFIRIFKEELKSYLDGLLGGDFNIYLENFEILSDKIFNTVVPTVVKTFTVSNDSGQGNGMVLCDLKLAATFFDISAGGKGINVDETRNLKAVLESFSDIISFTVGYTIETYSKKYKEKLSFGGIPLDYISHKSPGEKIDTSKYKYLYTFVICKDNVKDTNLTAPIFVYLDKFFDFLPAKPLNKKEDIISKNKISREEFIWWLKGFVEGKRKLSENELRLLKQKLEVI